MANILVDFFTVEDIYSGRISRYRVFIDDVTFNISVSIIGTTYFSLDPTDRGKYDGDLIADNCYGTTNVKVFASTSYPFAYTEIETNSNNCVVSPSCDIAIDSVTKTNETAYQLSNGSITVNASSSVTITGYSLDGVNYQSGNVFNNLSPGTYTVYVIDENVCITQTNITIDAALPVYGCLDPNANNYNPSANIADNSLCTYPVPVADIDEAYDRCYYFKLISENKGSIYIEEPVKWDSVNIILKRDPDWHGVNYEYSDGEIDLEFDCASGKDFIDEIYQEDGVNGLILFEFGYTLKQAAIPTEIKEFEGKLNLVSRKMIKERLSISVERAGLHDLIKSRFDTKINLFAGSDLDNKNVTAPTPYNLTLHPKVLLNNYNKTSKTEGTKAWTYHLEKNSSALYFTFNTTSQNAEESNIDVLGGTNLGSTLINPSQNDLYLFNLENDGDFTFNIRLNYDFNLGLQPTALGGTAQVNSWFLDNFLQINNEPPILIGTRKQGNPGTREIGNQNFQGSLTNYKRSLKRGDKVFVYARLSWFRNSNPSRSTYTYISVYETVFDIVAKTLTDFSTCNALLVHEALSHSARLITGQSDIVYSEFFGREDLLYPTDGCGSKNMITNGFEIRAFDRTKQNYKPPQISFSSLLKSLNSLFCIGMAYEVIDGVNKLRIEGRDYFYQDVEILELEDVGEYEDRVANDLIFNNIEIGYRKYLDEGFRLLDEPNTQHQYLSPIKRHNNLFSQLSDLIGSGYAIETTRRFQYKFNPEDSTKYDDDCFIISVYKQAGITAIMNFSNVPPLGSRITFPNQITFKVSVGDKLSVTGTQFNNGIFTVTNIISNAIYVTPNVNPEFVFATVSNVSEAYITEKDEAFEFVDNLISPETAYNLRHTPKRILLRWARWLNGSFFYQNAGDFIKNTFFKQNGALITRLKDTEPCPLGDLK